MCYLTGRGIDLLSYPFVNCYLAKRPQLSQAQMLTKDTYFILINTTKKTLNPKNSTLYLLFQMYLLQLLSFHVINVCIDWNYRLQNVIVTYTFERTFSSKKYAF